MGDLAKYIAEVIEFVVAGVLVFFSLLLLGYVVVRPDLAALPEDLPFLTSLGALLPVVGVALIYALGIIAEGMSRIMFEHGLGELTAKELKDKDSTKQQGEHAEKLARIRAVGVELEHSDKDIRRAVHDATVKHYEGVREEWRMYVLANSPSLTAQVDGQLKRLRIERAAALSGGIGSLALTIDVALTAGREGMPARAVTLTVLILATAIAARLWLVWKELPERGEKRDRASWKVACAATVLGSVLSLAVLLSLVHGAGSDVMGLRAALLVATVAVAACAVMLSLVRLKRYLSSIVRCYRALTDQPAVVARRQEEAALT